MRIIDCRSGRDNMRVGDVVRYPTSTNPLDGTDLAPEWWELLQVQDLGVWARVRIRTPHGEQWVKLVVRFLHPAFFPQRVGFFPS